MAFDGRFFDPSHFDTGDFTIEDTKGEILDLLRDNLYPQQTIGTTEVTLSTTINYEVAQYFIPYCTYYGGRESKHTLTTYLKLKKYGTPDNGLSVYLQEDSNTIPSSTLTSATIPPASINTSATTVSFDLVLTNPRLISKNRYWLRIVPNNTASTINYYTIYSEVTDENYLPGSYYKRESGGTWSAQLSDLYFQVETDNWIYGRYPSDTLDITDFPRIAIDLIDRPTLDERYIDSRIYKQEVNLAVVIYSRYPDELDKLCSYTNKIISRYRTSFSTAERAIPGRISPISILIRNILVRSIFYTFKQHISI